MDTEERTFTIGRDPQNDICIADDSVSARHAELSFLSGGRLMVTDCRSRNGTFHGLPDGRETRIRNDLISPLDSLRFGGVRLSVRQLVETIQLKFPQLGNPVAPTPTPLRRGRDHVRCERCGTPHVQNMACPVCGGRTDY